MTDLALIWDLGSYAADLALDGASLATEEGLRTAIIVSLFSDRRARDDDPLPQEGADRRGWWGDVAAAIEGDKIGSRLWLLRREKLLPRTLERAREYAAEALQWLIDDGVASAVEVTTEAQAGDVLAIGVVVVRPEGPTRQKFDFVWEAI